MTTCAVCDGAFFKGQEVIVIGGGDSAMEEALFLTKFAKKVTVVHRRDTFRASKIMQERFFKNPQCQVIWNSVVEEILGDGKKVSAVKLKNVNTGKSTEFKCGGVFLAIGHIPNTSIFRGQLEMDEQGYLQADPWMHTNISSLFSP